MSYEEFIELKAKERGFESWKQFFLKCHRDYSIAILTDFLIEAAELYAQSKVSEALKLAESLAEKRELWDRCYEETANRTFAMGLKGIAPKPEYKP